MSKSNEYGYIPDSPTQADGSNTGIFEVNDIIELLALGQWTLDQSGLVHIVTQTASGSTNSITFNNIQNDIYRTQIFVFSGGSTTTNTRLDMQLSADNGSTFISSSDYKSATIYGNNKTVNTQGNGSADTSMTYVASSDNSSTSATTMGYMIFSNWYDSTKYSTTVGGNIGYNTNDSSIYRGHVTKTLALTASHNAFRVYTANTSANIRSSTTMSLYGLV